MTKLQSNSKAWFRTLMGHVISYFGGSLALFCFICIFWGNIGGKIYLVTGVLIGLFLLVFGFMIRARKVDIDEEIGRVRKKHL